MHSLTLDDLVANRTMSPEIAATLRDGASARKSFENIEREVRT